MVENFDGQTSRQGLYTKMSDGTTQNSLPVYANSDSSEYLWMIGSYWVIGSDHTSNAIAIKNAVSRGTYLQILLKCFVLQNGDYCPEDGVGWKYYDGGDTNDGWADDSDAAVRCSDCDKFPTNAECSMYMK